MTYEQMHDKIRVVIENYAKSSGIYVCLVESLWSQAPERIGREPEYVLTSIRVETKDEQP